MTDRFGARYDPKRAEEVQERLRQIGFAEGISFTFDSKIGSTRDAHRLIELAKSKEVNVQTVIMNRLFEVYFEQHGDITSHAMLHDVAVASGLDTKEVGDWLESDRGGKEVDEQVKKASEGSGSGVPRYLIQGIYRVDGADDPSAFLDIFGQVKDRETQK